MDKLFYLYYWLLALTKHPEIQGLILALQSTIEKVTKPSKDSVFPSIKWSY